MRKPRDGRKNRDLGRDLAEALGSFTFLWREAVRLPRSRALRAVAALVFVLAMLLARSGSRSARAGAVLLGATALGGLSAMWIRERRVWQDAGRIIDRLAGRALPEQAAKARRALSLLGADGAPSDKAASPKLTQLHVARTLAALPAEAIAEEARRIARRFTFGALALGVATIAAIASNPWGVVEGADILLARGRDAPVTMTWLDKPELTARPPEYLHQQERKLRLGDATALPRGSLITFRGAQLHAGRSLALSDGTDEVPFVDDGAGKLIARWPLEQSVELRVVARFQQIRIQDSDTTPVKSIADLPPSVWLEGAPRLLRLVDAPAPVEIRYLATDDHGLREVHLVLRSGPREERRVLAKLDGETSTDRGGYLLKPSDAFFKKCHAPITVVVEARDNDPVTGPKWGTSEAITLVAPDIGEPETLRLAALRLLRDAYVDATAHLLALPLPSDPTARRKLVDAESLEQRTNALRLEETLAEPYGGARISERIRALLNGQAFKLDLAMRAKQLRQTPETHSALVKASETMALVIDAIVRGQGQRDAKSAAKQLVEVADDLALGAAQSLRPGEVEHAATRFAAATEVLDAGRKQLAYKGALGRDLAGAVAAALQRAARAAKASDWTHAELAARDLAARLRQPDPSFGAKGSAGGHASGESGSDSGGAGDDSGGEAERAFNEAAQEIETLAQDHAGAMGDVERALSQAQSQEDLAEARNEAERHAKAVREAMAGMPSIGTGSDSWSSRAAAAKELAEQMARALEQGNPANAVESGKSALLSLGEARRVARRAAPFDRGTKPGTADLDEARSKLETEVAWADKQLAELRMKAAKRAAADLQKSGGDEAKIAERAGKVGEKSRDLGSLPEAALDALGAAEQLARDAAQALRQGDADRGMQLQRGAQRQLEAAREALGRDEANDERRSDADGTKEGDDEPGGHADIPKADAHKGPEEFRRRVVKGLAQPGSARQRDAIKRYAEGLLR